jgi:hypothetical protein
VLTPLTNVTALPGFLRNIRRLELNAGLTPTEVAEQLRGELTAVSVPEVDDDHRLLAHAVDTLEWAREGVRDYEGWFRIEQILHAMSVAMTRGDLEPLRRLIRDLEHIGQATATMSSGRHPAPVKVLNLVADISRGVQRRLRKLPPM